MANEAKSLGLGLGLKNALAVVDNVTDVIQFAVNEECAVHNECNKYNNFTASGKPVFHIEYGSADQSTEFCVKTGAFSTVIKNPDLDGWVHYCDGSDSITPVSQN
jgi:endo-alpha-1,4-polygalactosaminidase (GH114 family)